MKLFQTILVLISLLLITNCIGAPSKKVDISTVKKENKLPEPDFLIPDASYMAATEGWNLRQFLNFRFYSPPFFTSKEANLHKSAVFTALNHMKDFEVVSWYSKKRLVNGKVRVIHSYPTGSGLCRTYQAYIKVNGTERHTTNNACKQSYSIGWSFYN